MRATRSVVKPSSPCFAIPAQPNVELRSRHAEEAARLGDILGDLFVVFDHAQASSYLAGLLLGCHTFSHPRPPLVVGSLEDTPGVRDLG